MITMAIGTRSALRWNSVRVAALMDERDIMDRDELARRVPAISRATAYRTFNADWDGEATVHVLVSICQAFDVPLARLVVEPSSRLARQ